MKVLSKLSLREDARVLTPKEMKSLKGGSGYCRCEGEGGEPFPVASCEMCANYCTGASVCVG